MAEPEDDREEPGESASAPGDGDPRDAPSDDAAPADSASAAGASAEDAPAEEAAPAAASDEPPTAEPVDAAAETVLAPPAARVPASPAGVPAPGPRIVEIFTLRRARAIEAKLGETARQQLARALALGTQKAEAAETLWQNGHSAEGLRIGVEALDATLAALPSYADALGIAPGADPKSRRAAVLRDRGLSPKAIAQVESALTAAHSTPLPQHERDVAPAHTPLWRDLAGAQHVVARAMRDAGRSRRELRMTSIARIANTVLVALLVTGGFVLATRTPEGVFVEASGTWADAEAFSPEKAIDGRNDTWWLAPDGVESTLDVSISPPRRVQRVRLLNGTNPPHHDRGTRDYRVELYANGRVARTVEGTLEHRTTGAPEFVEHEIGLDGVDRIRFTARTHYAIGAGLAELQFE